MEAWVIITIAAAFVQNIRSSLQRHLKGVMGTTGATFVRFGFGLPFALFFLFAALAITGQELPVPNQGFLIWTSVGAFAQIAAQALLVQMFSLRNFAVGSAYSRTEPAQAAIFGLLFLGEWASPGALMAISISVAGVMLISLARGPVTMRGLVTSLFTRTAGIGLASGTIFGIAAVAYRAASLSLGQDMSRPDYLVQAAAVLSLAIILQTVAMLGWMIWRDRAELARIRAAWRLSALTGLAGATASFGWFAAMTLQQAAIVKALAQIEMLFAFASTVFIFHEKINQREIIGCLLIAGGIILLLIMP